MFTINFRFWHLFSYNEILIFCYLKWEIFGENRLGYFSKKILLLLQFSTSPNWNKHENRAHVTEVKDYCCCQNLIKCKWFCRIIFTNQSRLLSILRIKDEINSKWWLEPFLFSFFQDFAVHRFKRCFKTYSLYLNAEPYHGQFYR